MFAQRLSSALLQLCAENQLTQEMAAERCGVSHRYFGDIVRQASSPTIRVLEQICNAFHATPDQLLLSEEERISELAFRVPMRVAQRAGTPTCPRCDEPLGRAKPNYCAHCGQCLSWNHFV